MTGQRRNAPDAPDWEREGVDWPLRETSRFVSSGGVVWHVQQAGEGPDILLVHGTGAATHSWRDLVPILTPHARVTAMDLPGHGFTGPLAGGASLPAVSEALGRLLADLGVSPALAIGHSAGAAILARMSLDRRIEPRALIALNGAFLPFRGLAGQIFSPLAKMLVWNPFVPRLFAWGAAESSAVERLVRDTGSRLDPRGLDLYRRLLRRPGHVGGALAMMAHWDLDALGRDLVRLRVPLTLLAGSADKAVSPEDAFRVRERIPGARVELLKGLGHLAHEEDPRIVAQTILRIAAETGAIGQP